MRKITFLLACLFFAGVGLVQAQSKSISGKVLSAEDGQPIIGATVKVKGTSMGTITDTQGNFIITLQGESKNLLVSYVGMKTADVEAKPNMQVNLVSDALLIDEVLVVAYGTAKKSAFTGSAVKITGEKLDRKSQTEVSKALAGEVAGVQVFNTSGQPGSSASIRIRGVGSMNSSNAPLYVVDGMPYEGNINSLSPSDIESTTVLKDATAAALYGSRASNGVILITTKKGEKGTTKIEADVKVGFSARYIPQYSSIKSPERFMEITWESLKNRQLYGSPAKTEAEAIAFANTTMFSDAGIPAGYNMWNATGDKLIDPTTGKFIPGIARKYTPESWSDNIFRTGKKTDASIRISGGADKINYFTSFGYLKDEGYYIGSDFTRFNVRNSVTTEVATWLKSVLNLSYAHTESDSPGQTDSQNNGFQFVNFMPSIYPVFRRDADGNLIEDKVVGGNLYDYGLDIGEGRPYASGINPAGAIQLDKNKNIINEFNGTSAFDIKFLKEFKININNGINYYATSEDVLTNPYYGDAKGIGRIRKSNFSFLQFTSTQILTWTKEIGLHAFNAFVAHESNYVKWNTMQGGKSAIQRADNLEWTNALIMGDMGSETMNYGIESLFGQIRYDYNDKYHFNATFRRDGSSRFADGKKWGNFGSLGTAWVLSKETFLSDVDWLNNLKLKASWGILGNQDLNTGFSTANLYPTEDLNTISNMNGLPSFTFLYKGNPDLTWEKSSTINIGLELKLFNKLECELEYFHKSTTDMLFMQQVSPSLGYARYPVNDGEMANQGFEFTLNYDAIKTNNVKLNLRVNGGFYQNEIIKMPKNAKGEPKEIEIQGTYGWSAGKSYYDYYLREYAGVNPTNGVALYNQYVNVKADGTKENIADMASYVSKNTIGTLEVVTTEKYEEATKKFIGKSAIPDLSGGFGFDLTVKGIELSSTFTYALGGYAYDGVYQSLMSNNTAGSSNWHTDIESRWQKPGDITDVPKLNEDFDPYTSSTSDRFLTSRSYLNLSSIRLGYNFPAKLLKKINVKKLSIYATGDNLFLVSAREGFVAMSSVSGASTRSQYLPVTTIMGGVKIEF